MTTVDVPLDAPGTAPRGLPVQALLTKVDPRTIGVAVFALVGSGGFAAPVLLLLVVGGVAASAVAWSRFRYGYDGDVLRVEQGVLQRQLRAVDVGRVQQVELDEPLVHRLLGLARLRVETASEGGEAEVVLDGLLLADATALRDALRLRSRGATATATGGVVDEGPPLVTLLEVPIRDIVVGAVTGSRLVLFPVVVGFVAAQLLEFGDVEVDRLVSTALGLGTVIAVLLPLLAVGVAVVSAVVQEGDFRLARRGDDLVVSRGLLTRREAVVPRHRVQVVVVEQNWLRRSLGVATVEVRSGGSGVGGDAARTLKVPLVREDRLPRVLSHLLDDVPDDRLLVSHPPEARRRAVVRWTLRLLLPLAAPVVIGIALLGPALAWLLLLVPVGGMVLGLAEYSQLAHATSDTVVAARDGALAIRRSYAPLARVQGVVRSANPFQRRLGLETLTVHLVGAGGGVRILDAAATDTPPLTAALAGAPARTSR